MQTLSRHWHAAPGRSPASGALQGARLACSAGIPALALQPSGSVKGARGEGIAPLLQQQGVSQSRRVAPTFLQAPFTSTVPSSAAGQGGQRKKIAGGEEQPTAGSARPASTARMAARPRRRTAFDAVPCRPAAFEAAAESKVLALQVCGSAAEPTSAADRKVTPAPGAA